MEQEIHIDLIHQHVGSNLKLLFRSNTLTWRQSRWTRRPESGRGRPVERSRPDVIDRWHAAGAG
jgi:hypothetical protein